DLLLGEIADLHGVPDAYAAAVGLALADDRAQQRRLAGSVRADECDVLTALERERSVVQQPAFAYAQRELVGLYNRAPASRRIDEAEAEASRAAREQRDLVRDLSLLLREASDLRELRLSLLGLRLLVAEARDETLEPRDVLGVARSFLRRGLQ